MPESSHRKSTQPMPATPHKFSHGIRPCLQNKTRPFSPEKGMALDTFLDRIAQLGFQARNLGEAFQVYRAMLQDSCTIFMGLAGAMTAAGMRRTVVFLLENHLIDCLVSTGANLFHDAYETLGFHHFQLSPEVDDEQLRKEYLDRVYDVVCDEIEFRNLEKIIWNDFAKTLESGCPYTTRELLFRLGEFLTAREKEPGILTTAYREQIPIYCPAIADSSLGIAFQEGLAKGFQFLPDVIRDVWETGEMVRQSENVGVFFIGGGTPKNFINQAAVVPSITLDQDFGHKYAIQFTADSPHWGGLSGCTFEEAKSWGKIDREARLVTVYGDATIGLALLSQALCEILPEGVRGKRALFTYGDQVSVEYVSRI